MLNDQRLNNAKAMGFNVDTVYYHGGFEAFTAFDEALSGSGAFSFALSREFAHQYAATRSMDEQGDYDIVVRGFYLPEKLFDFRDPEHLAALSAVLPDELSIEGRYGWAAFAGKQVYSKAALLEQIQGIGFPYTGLDEETIASIKSGNKIYRRDGGMEYVLNYDHEHDILEYAPQWAVDKIIGLESEIDFLTQTYGPDFWSISLKRLELKQKKEGLKSYKMAVYPEKRADFDNWELLESPELRVYLRQLGFEGAHMQERKQATVTVFDKHRIRLVDAEFDPDTFYSDDLMGEPSQTLSPC